MSSALSALAPPPSIEELYSGGGFLAATGGTWDAEDSPWKAEQIMKMLRSQKLDVRSVCEIGCGAGGILTSLRAQLDKDVRFVGYEISPQAHELSLRSAADNLSFVLGDALSDEEKFELVLVMDVVEHVEDCFDFLRNVKKKGKYKLFHIPLEINCSAALRDIYWRGYPMGHIHHFSFNTAIQTLRFAGHEIVDYTLTASAVELAAHPKTHLMNVLRRMLPAKYAARICGGYSLLALTT